MILIVFQMNISLFIVESLVLPFLAKHQSALNYIFSRESDSRDSVVLDWCGYIKSKVWLCSKRCGYVKDGVVMLKKVWLCCHQNLNTPFISQTVNGVAGVVMLKMVWLCSSISQLSHQLTFQL